MKYKLKILNRHNAYVSNYINRYTWYGTDNSDYTKYSLFSLVEALVAQYNIHEYMTKMGDYDYKVKIEINE